MSTPSAAPEVTAPVSGDGSGLVLKDVYRVFPGNITAVENANLHVENGEYVTLLGPSGCGKTTTLRMIGGHDEPSSGTISLDGQVLNGVEPAKRPVTTVFQHFALFPHRSVLQNVAFGLKMRGIGKAEREKTASDAIDMVGLGTMKQRKPRELSSGQQQRVALARVLVTRPKAILLDEPFGDLDRLLQLRMRVELRALQRDLGITFIHVTHNQEEALSMSDRIVVMSDGRHPADRDADRARALPQERLRGPLHGRQQHRARPDRVGRRRHHHDPRTTRGRAGQGHGQGR